MKRIPVFNRGSRMWQLRVHLTVLGRVKIHPLFIALLIVAWMVGLFQDTLILFILIILHELGHAAVANHLGYEVQEVSLLPFGGVARLAYGNMGFTPRHEALVAIAGPFVNLILVLIAWTLYQCDVWTETFFHSVVQLNLWIVVFNLLPGLPLDGGRILRAARARTVGYEVATREAYRVALVIATVLAVIGGVTLWVGHPHLGMLILGLFLLISAWTGRRDIRMDTVRFLDAKRHIQAKSPQFMHCLATPETTQLKDLVVRFAPDRYHVFYILSESGEVEAMIGEDKIIEAVFQGGWLWTVGELR